MRAPPSAADPALLPFSLRRKVDEREIFDPPRAENRLKASENRLKDFNVKLEQGLQLARCDRRGVEKD
ncbi:MAG TPA: hypothetical protein VGG79_07090 [Roseiarcus sp.]